LSTPIAGAVVGRLNRDADYYAADPWRGRWATEGGGVLMTQVIHHIDLLQWFMGPVRRVTGRVATLARESVEVEDTASAIIEFTSGGQATVQVGTTFDPGLGVQVWIGDARGRTASLIEYPEGVGSIDTWTLPGEEEHVDVFGPRGVPDLPLTEIHRQLVPFHALQIADFVEAVRSGREPAVTGQEALKSLEIVQAIYESSRTGTAQWLTDG
jgi:predicted dehydrogenase